MADTHIWRNCLMYWELVVHGRNIGGISLIYFYFIVCGRLKYWGLVVHGRNIVYISLIYFYFIVCGRLLVTQNSIFAIEVMWVYSTILIAQCWALFYFQLNKDTLRDLECSENTATVKLQWLEHGWLVYRCWFELVSISLGKCSENSRNEILKYLGILYGYFSEYYSMKLYVFCTQQNPLEKAILITKLNISLYHRISTRHPESLVNTQWLVLPMSETNVDGSKYVRAT